MNRFIHFCFVSGYLWFSSITLPTAQPTTGQSTSAGWSAIPVPGSWESSGLPQTPNYDGYALYRAWIKPHDSFFSKHERNLFAESVTLFIRSLANAHEVFVNGTSVGKGGAFPPGYQDGVNGNHRHKIQPGLLKQNLWNEIRIRVYNPGGAGGFLKEGPFIMDYFNECIMEGTWDFVLGEPPEGFRDPQPQRPPTSAFDTYHEAHRALGAAETLVHGKRLPAIESLALMDPSSDYKVELLLAEPLVAQPTHLSYDERGRLWVSQYRQYPYPAGLKMLSRDKYYRAHYDKVPPAPPNHDRGRDLISVHEDTDSDGVYDRHKIFQDGLNLANAAVRGRGGVWVMHTPYLLFYPDADFDDVPDGPPVVHLAGFGIEDTHSVANGLVWGMDGWLYGGQGSTTSSHVVRPGIDPKETSGVYFEGCMVWRYHPETRAYEIFAEGSGNTFGLEIDSEGRLFSGHNGGETRGWHYVQGGYYLKQGFDPGKFGPQRNPYTYGDLGVIRPKKPIQRFSHLFAMGDGSALPPGSKNQLYAVDPLHNVVMMASRSIRGSTFETEDVSPVLLGRDEGFRPVFIVNAPDGSLHIADFYEYYIAHGQHYQSQIDPTTGRIYRLKGRDQSLEKLTDLTKLSSLQWVDLLGHPNKWHRHTSVRLLGEKKDPAAVPILERRLATVTKLPALGSLWALHQMNEISEKHFEIALNHPDPDVRTWAVRLAGDKWGVNPGLGSSNSTANPASDKISLPATIRALLLKQASAEPHPETRSQFAASARRFDTTTALELVETLARNSVDLSDPFIPALCWWVIDNKFEVNPGEVIRFFDKASRWELPILRDHTLPRLVRRLVTEGQRQSLTACAALFRAAPSSQHKDLLLNGFKEALKGRTLPNLPPELESQLVGLVGYSRFIELRAKTPSSIQQALLDLNNSKTDVEHKLQIVRILGEIKAIEAVETLLNIARSDPNPQLKRMAITSLAVFPDQAISSQLVSLLPKLPEPIRKSALSALVSRIDSCQTLLKSIASGDLDPKLISMEISLLLRKHSNPEIAKLASTTLAPPKPSNGFEKMQAKIESVLKSGTGNPYEGEKLFENRCAGCHKLFYKGGTVGPDLTHYQRDNLNTLLVSLLDPNVEVREGYATVEIETTDGRNLTGFVSDRDADVVVLRGLDSQDILVRQSEILKLEPTGRSLMPEGLLDDMNEQQLRNFFAYLRSSQPFTR